MTMAATDADGVAGEALPDPAPKIGRRRSSSEQAALYIRRLIFDGHLRPGSRVPQDDIAHALGLSRVPVREALIALEREGFVTIELHRGAFVNALDESTVIDHYELYGVLYGFAVVRAMGRGSSDLVERLSDIERAFSATEDPAAAWHLALAFHSTIVDGVASPRLRVLLRAMSTLVPANLFAVVPGAIETERQGFRAILRAMRRDDADRAAHEYRRMLGQTGKQVAQLFEERGLFVQPFAATMAES